MTGRPNKDRIIDIMTMTIHHRVLLWVVLLRIVIHALGVTID